MSTLLHHPASASGFIGPAGRVALVLERKLQRHRQTGEPFRQMFSGPPGTGKTALALMLARQLAASEFGYELINGGNVTADTVRRWHSEFFVGSMFTDWRAIIIDEADGVSAQAQKLLLTFIDQLPRHRAVFATTNHETSELIERFQTRFQLWRIGKPEPREIVDHLLDHLRARVDGPGAIAIAPATLGRIAEACNGNVRSALLDLESELDVAAALG